MSNGEERTPRQPDIEKIDTSRPVERPVEPGRSLPTNQPTNLPGGGGGDDQGFGPGAELPNTKTEE